MGHQIVKRKKKGRPSKADPTAHKRRSSASKPSSEPEVRRSLRRRSVKYNFEYDGYLDDDFEEFDEEDDDAEENEKRREKKLKLVLKLNQGESEAREGHAQESDDDDEDDDDDDEDMVARKKKKKKRRINGGDDDDGGGEGEVHGGYCEEEKEQKVESKEAESPPGTPADASTGLPLPDKKTLELILDKLQKKDTYGVYAEPVDPEELPDYHDVIEHPMDFATVRKKLANGSYSTLEQFESDVFLICSNAMQYNASDTVYHKQARAIQELAKKKFEKVRLDIERSEKESKPEPRMKSNSLVKKQTKKPLGWASQEPIGSDFSSGATLATVSDVHKVGCYERPSNNDGHVEANPSLVETNIDKAEELSSGRGLLSKMGRKASVAEENRRDTYNISNQPIVRSESVFTTFEGEVRQLLPVGLHADHSYARSLARFAATLGPVAWKVASQRIEQALPPGSKYGRGWVGEYEPLPTPVLVSEKFSQRDCPLLNNPKTSASLMKGNETSKHQPASKDPQITGPALGGKPNVFGRPGGPILEGKPSFFSSAGLRPSTPVNGNQHQQNSSHKGYTEVQNKVSKQMELNSLPSSSQNNVSHGVEKQFSGNMEMRASRSGEMVSRNLGLQHSVPSNRPNINGGSNGGLPNGNITGDYLGNRVVNPPNGVPNQLARGATPFPQGQQGLSDPVKLMRMLAENAHQQQQKSTVQSSVNAPPSMPSVPSTKREDPNSAAARAWMSVGTGGFKQSLESNTSTTQISLDLYNSPRGLHSQNSQARGEFPVSGGMQLQSDKDGFPVQAFVPQTFQMVNGAQFQNRLMGFPQVVTADLSRFQMQSPWQGNNPQMQLKQRQETLPPDLNIGFNSPGSPTRQSSGVAVDSQQPDLALQL